MGAMPLSPKPPLAVRVQRVLLGLLIAVGTTFPALVSAQDSPASLVVDAPRVILGGVPFALDLQGSAGAEIDYEVRDARGTVLGSGSTGVG